MDQELDDKTIEEITPYIIETLIERRLFEYLDDQLCPANTSATARVCSHDYEFSIAALRHCGFDSAEIADIKQVMFHNGGHCDCEILYNVAEESRLKAKYWKKGMPKLNRESYRIISADARCK
jgi:Protein of unknown function (DUF2695)